MLGSHGVAHVFNSWTRIPSVAEQIELPGAFCADFTVARLLLKPGRTYEQAVTMFSPYKAIQEPNDEVKDAAKSLILKAKGGKRPSFLFVNNRLEGNAPKTISSIVQALEISNRA